MSKVTIPAGYKTPLSTYEMQRAIEFIKSNFQVNLGQALNLRRVSAPLFVEENSGLNDNLNGVERPVSFDIPDVGAQGQVVHSLAKWKRLALKRYDFKPGKGLFTDMNAIRRDEEVDNLHSVYVDQWDWEKVIERRDRNVAYLEQTVRAIVGAVVETNDALQIAFPSLHTKLDREVFFVTTQELEDRWPDYTPKQREDAICKEHHTVFLMQIGDDLKRSGKPHDGRAPDYDDWSLNGDILMYNPVLDRAFEISSMGIRVDEAAMDYQLHKRGCDDRRELPFHKMLLAGQLPLTIGGGIGQSRLCMLMIGTCHIGEVQASLWDKETMEACEKAGVMILYTRYVNHSRKGPPQGGPFIIKAPRKAGRFCSLTAAGRAFSAQPPTAAAQRSYHQRRRSRRCPPPPGQRAIARPTRYSCSDRCCGAGCTTGAAGQCTVPDAPWHGHEIPLYGDGH